jgi:translation initiation factor eIF-2B subunit gamma
MINIRVDLMNDGFMLYSHTHILSRAINQQKKGGLAREEEDVEYIALSHSPNNKPRVVWKQSKIDVEDDEHFVGQTPKLVLPKPRLRVPGEYVQVSRDWADLHVYVLSPWVRTLLRERRGIFSIQGDGIPLCVARQFRGIRQTFGSRVEDAVVEQEVLSSPTALFGQGESTLVSLDNKSNEEYAVRAHILDGWKALRASTIPSYLYACKEVMNGALQDEHGTNPCLFLPPKTKKNEKFHWIALDGLEAGEKIQCRSSTIGRRSKLGDRCKLNNVVVMDDVTIGENCVIQNSIIGAGCVIGEKCSLNDCQVAPGKAVPPLTKEKGESLVDDM